MRVLNSILTLAFTLLLLSSCSRQSDGVTLIPEEAGLVVAFNVELLADKANIEEWDELEFFEAFKDEMSSESRGMSEIFEDLIDDPASAGMDLRKDVHYFMAAEGRGGRYGGFTLEMLDEDDFETFIEDLIRETDAMYDDHDFGDYKAYNVQGELGIIWNSDRAAFITPLGYMDDDELLDRMEYLAEMDEKDLLVQDESFNHFLNNAEDMGVWVSSDLISNFGLDRQLRREIGMDLGDNKMSLFATFEDDLIDITMKTEMDEDNVEMIEKYELMSNSLDGDLLEYLPGEFVVSGGLAVNVEGILAMIKEERDYKDLYRTLRREDEALEMLELLTGDAAMVISGFEEKEVTYSDYDYYTYQSVEKTRIESVPVFGVIAGCSDSDAFIDAMEDQVPSIQNKGDLKLLIEGDQMIYIGANDEGLIFTNDEDMAQEFQDEEEADDSLADTDAGEKLDGTHLYLNFVNDMRFMPEEQIEDMDEEEVEMMQKIDDLADYSELYFDGKSTSQMNIYAHEGEGNILWRIAQLADEMYKETRAY